MSKVTKIHCPIIDKYTPIICVRLDRKEITLPKDKKLVPPHFSFPKRKGDRPCICSIETIKTEG